jgi:hydrogenase maturation protease
MGPHRDLIVAWGNPDRRDDAAGLAVAEGLCQRAGGREDILVFHQLPPELAEDLSRAARVLFIDASVDTGDEDVTLRRIRSATSSHADISHHLPPERLLGLAKAVYGRSPKAWLLTVRAHDTDFGKALSPHTARLIERAIDTAAKWEREVS